MMRHIFFFLIFLIFSLSAFSQEGMYQKCLKYRLNNDSEYKVFQLELNIAETELKKMKNSSIANLELGVSESVFSISKEKARTGYSFNPYVNFSLPIYNNTGLKMNLPTSKMGYTSSNAFNITAFTEVYGISRKSKKLELLIAEEKRNKALKNLKMAEQYVEKKLLKELKELFAVYLESLDKKLKEAQANIAYEQLKVQGYGETSVKMRTGKLDLLATQRDLKEAEFAVETKYRKFLTFCGIGISEKKDDDHENMRNVTQAENHSPVYNEALANTPSLAIEELLTSLFESIPKMELINLDNFGTNNYIQLVDAKKAYEINKTRRELSIHLLTVTAESGLTHSKKSIPSAIPSMQAQEMTEQSFTAGVGFKLPGTKIMAGLDFPFDEKRRGDVQFKFGFAINPIEIWNYILERKNVATNNEIEQLKLQDKIDAFDIVWDELNSKRSFIEWKKHMADEQLGIYQENMKEYEVWLKRGVIGKSEKQRADIEYEKAKVRQLDAIIAINSFNIETSLLFEKE